MAKICLWAQAVKSIENQNNIHNISFSCMPQLDSELPIHAFDVDQQLSALDWLQLAVGDILKKWWIITALVICLLKPITKQHDCPIIA